MMGLPICISKQVLRRNNMDVIWLKKWYKTPTGVALPGLSVRLFPRIPLWSVNQPHEKWPSVGIIDNHERDGHKPPAIKRGNGKATDKIIYRFIKGDGFHIENSFFSMATFESERAKVQHQKTWNWGWSFVSLPVVVGGSFVPHFKGNLLAMSWAIRQERVHPILRFPMGQSDFTGHVEWMHSGLQASKKHRWN